MYCSNCGYDLKEKSIEKVKKSAEFRTKDTSMVYVCPRCGHLIKSGLSEDDIKALSRASHAEIHRSRNIINGGLAILVIGVILAAIAYMFYLMSYKANAGGILVTDCTEFYVFICLLCMAIISFVYSSVSLFLGVSKNRKYNLLLKDIQDNIFIQ